MKPSLLPFAAGAAVLLASAPAVAAAAQEPIHYTLSPVFERGALVALAVGMDFKADPSGVTRLAFAPRWAGKRQLGQFQRDLRVTGARAFTAGANGSAEIRARPGARLHVSYRIVSAYDHAPTTADSAEARPVIVSQWFYAPGEVLFARPEGADDAPATFDWTEAPTGFAFASDLQHLAGRHRQARRPGTVSDVLESAVIGGRDLQVFEGQGADAGVRVAALGGFEHFDLRAFTDQAFRTIRGERAFWGESGDPFLITLFPLQVLPGLDAYTGIGRSDAFALRVGADLTLADIRLLLAHEYFHTWNGLQLGAMAGDNRDAWLTEGFTDFYARRLLLRSGLFNLEDFASAWNQALLAYGVSPARTEPEARIAADFWNDENVGDLPYKRGAMLAALFDARLRDASHGARSLDDVVRAMRSRNAETPGTPIAQVFQGAFQDVANESPAAEVDRYEIRGELLRLPENAFACLRLTDVSQPVWDLGYDPVTTAEDGVFRGVDPTGPAYAAGLRNGMKRLSREGGAMNDSSVELLLHVATPDGSRRDIRYRPEGKTRVTFQRLVVPAGLTAEQRAACVSELSSAPQAR